MKPPISPPAIPTMMSPRMPTLVTRTTLFASQPAIPPMIIQTNQSAIRLTSQGIRYHSNEQDVCQFWSSGRACFSKELPFCAKHAAGDPLYQAGGTYENQHCQTQKRAE